MLKFLTKRDTDMTNGGILRHLLTFAAPLALGLLFQQLYNTVDAVIVGQFISKEALAAVGSTGPIINMFVGFCAGLATGSSVIISQTYGAHENDRLVKAVHTTVTFSLILSVLATVAGVLLVVPMLNIMKAPADVFPVAEEYLTIYFYGISGMLLYNMGSGILRAVGDSVRPLIFLIFSAVVNTVADIVFVVVFKLGVAGVAYATVASQFLSAILVFVVLLRTKAAYGLRLRRLGIDFKMLMSVFRIGLPAGIQQAVTSFSNVFVQSYINGFGSAAMAGWAGCSKIDQFILIPVQSIALSSTTFVGQNWGAKKPERAREGVRRALTMSIIITAALSVVNFAAAPFLISLFSEEPDVIYYGARFIHLIAPFYVTICFNQIFAGALRGIGNAKVPMVIMLSSFVVFRQMFLFVNSLFGGTFVPVAISYPMGWMVCSILVTVFYMRSRLIYPDGLPEKRKKTWKITVYAGSALLVCAMVVFSLFYTGVLKFNNPSKDIYPVRGVDVSHYQGVIDWDKLSEQGVDFAFIKATEGSEAVDEYYEKNADSAHKAGVAYGAYHFFSFESAGALQAENYIKTVGQTDLPHVIDIELYGGFIENKPDTETVRKQLGDMIEALTEKYGQPPVIYTTEKEYNMYIKDFFDCDIWIRNILREPEITDWTFWQYTNRERLDGYEGEESFIDMNVFNGTREEFESYILKYGVKTELQ